LRGKDDALDAVRTARAVLAREGFALPRNGSNGRRCDFYWSHVEAPSMSAAKRSDNLAA